VKSSHSTLVRLSARWAELRRCYAGRGFGVERLDELRTMGRRIDGTAGCRGGIAAGR
jgi:hypothetical protein